MPLGDSITKGGSSGVIPDDQTFYVSYRKALWDKLEAAGYVTDFVGSQIGGSAIPDFDPDHEGHGGWRDDEILNGRKSEPNKGKLIEWLINQQPDIVLLHIGTNGVESSPDHIEAILDIIDFYSLDVWVVLARIINRSCITDDPSCSESVTTTTFNNNTTTMAQNRIDNLGDKIILVDMEDGAGIDYFAFPAGDMWDNLHPYETGYLKMADLWFTALDQILQSVDGTNVVLDYIEIEGPPILNENSRANYYCRAYYTNGTNRLVMANNWNEDSLFADIPNMGNLINEEVLSDESVEIYAIYSEGNITKNTTYDVIVRDLFTYNLQSRVSKTGSVSQGEWVYYQLEASASDADILVELTNLSANVDLYVLAGFIPTLTDYDCRPSQSGTTSETCIVQNSQAITWYVGVYGYQTGNFTITATLPIFNDVPIGHWADDYIYAIYNAGITTGCAQNPLRYRPQNPVNRAQMAAFLARAFLGME
ncbi:MAG: pre-peptidase C-terminal domain-containing protein [Anaerolineales bacterium]|nr:MAG: pre-peptidase C-terminal domain-containing protein [Anaerolineales bacterium]